jgi:hypothetical protein
MAPRAWRTSGAVTRAIRTGASQRSLSTQRTLCPSCPRQIAQTYVSEELRRQRDRRRGERLRERALPLRALGDRLALGGIDGRDPRSDVEGELPWASLCEEAAKLKIRLREGRLIVLPKVANSDGAAENLLQPLLQTRRVNPERSVLSALSTSSVSVPDGIRSREGTYQEVESDCISPEVSGVSDESNRAECVQPKDDCSNVVNASRTERQNRIADELAAVRTVWLRAGDEKALRRDLLDLLRHLEQNE